MPLPAKTTIACHPIRSLIQAFLAQVNCRETLVFCQSTHLPGHGRSFSHIGTCVCVCVCMCVCLSVNALHAARIYGWMDRWTRTCCIQHPAVAEHVRANPFVPPPCAPSGEVPCDAGPPRGMLQRSVSMGRRDARLRHGLQQGGVEAEGGRSERLEGDGETAEAVPRRMLWRSGSFSTTSSNLSAVLTARAPRAPAAPAMTHRAPAVPAAQDDEDALQDPSDVGAAGEARGDVMGEGTGSGVSQDACLTAEMRAEYGVLDAGARGEAVHALVTMKAGRLRRPEHPLRLVSTREECAANDAPSSCTPRGNVDGFGGAGIDLVAVVDCSGLLACSGFRVRVYVGVFRVHGEGLCRRFQGLVFRV